MMWILYKGKRGEHLIRIEERVRGVVTTWQWESLGNNGEEKTREEAIAAARDWIEGNQRPKRELQ